MLSTWQSSRQPRLLLNFLFAGAPLVLKRLIESQSINILAPPLAPAGEKDLLRVLGQIVARKGAEDALCSYRPLAPCSTKQVEILVLTLWNRLRIRHIHRQLYSRSSTYPRAWDKARRDGDNGTLPPELAAPPMRPKQLHKLGFTIDGAAVRARARFEVLVE